MASTQDKAAAKAAKKEQRAAKRAKGKATRSQLKQAFDIQRKRDKALIPIMLACVLGGGLLFFLLGLLWGGPVRVATLSGLGDRPADVVRPGDAVAPYLLAPGFFARRCTDEARAAGATVVADVLGAHPCVVELVAHRAQVGLALARRAARAGIAPPGAS